LLRKEYQKYLGMLSYEDEENLTDGDFVEDLELEEESEEENMGRYHQECCIYENWEDRSEPFYQYNFGGVSYFNNEYSLYAPRHSSLEMETNSLDLERAEEK
jgi:hypothetical protein